MAAYRCSPCDLGFRSSDPCAVCGKAVWWSSTARISDREAVNAAVRAMVRDNLWSPSADKTVNWRFERLITAGYDVASAEEIAVNRTIDLHDAIALVKRYGAQGATLMLL